MVGPIIGGPCYQSESIVTIWQPMLLDHHRIVRGQAASWQSKVHLMRWQGCLQITRHCATEQIRYTKQHCASDESYQRHSSLVTLSRQFFLSRSIADCGNEPGSLKMLCTSTRHHSALDTSPTRHYSILNMSPLNSPQQSLHQHVTTQSSTLHQHVTTQRSKLHQHVTTHSSTLHQHVTTQPSTLHQHVTTQWSKLHQHVTTHSSTLSLPSK